MNSTHDLATTIRAAAATLTKAWPLLEDPTRPAGVRTRAVPGSRLPGNADALSLRVELVRDLAFWVHAIVDDNPAVLDEVHTVPVPTLTATTTWVDWVVMRCIDATDVPAALSVLTEHAAWLSGWEHGPRLGEELHQHARDARTIAWPTTGDTMPLGECPNRIGTDQHAPTCGTTVRATPANPGDIRCKGCGLTDTIDGWILRIVGNEPLVTAEQLIPLLRKRMGIVATRSVIRGWKARGTICSSGKAEDGQTDLYDRQAVFAALTRWEARRDGKVGA